jgi:hypothetical protein
VQNAEGGRTYNKCSRRETRLVALGPTSDSEYPPPTSFKSHASNCLVNAQTTCTYYTLLQRHPTRFPFSSLSLSTPGRAGSPITKTPLRRHRERHVRQPRVLNLFRFGLVGFSDVDEQSDAEEVLERGL